jgi:hypothetical protein
VATSGRLKKRVLTQRGVRILGAVALTCAITLEAQPGPRRFRLAYVLLLDVRGLDNAGPVDEGIAYVKSNVELDFQDSVVVYVRALGDSTRACKRITTARDCDVVILHQTHDESDPEKRRIAQLEWIRGPKHGGFFEPVPKPLRCRSQIDFATCRFRLSAKIVDILDRHFRSPKFNHTTP